LIVRIQAREIALSIEQIAAIRISLAGG